MAESHKPIKVAIKYCGCCNPQVDLSQIAHHLLGIAENRADFVLVPFPEDKIDVAVILCGCPRACGNKEEVKARARQHLVVAGESVDGKATREEFLPQTVQQALEKIINRDTY